MAPLATGVDFSPRAASVSRPDCRPEVKSTLTHRRLELKSTLTHCRLELKSTLTHCRLELKSPLIHCRREVKSPLTPYAPAPERR